MSRFASLFVGIGIALGVVLNAGFATAEVPRVPSGVERLCTNAAAGGLCVLVGCPEDEPVIALTGTGRYLVHALLADDTAVNALRTKLHAAGLYGLASAERRATDGKLPYTENLANIVVLGGEQAGGPTIAEALRVLCPGGTLLVTEKLAGEAELRAAGLEDVRAADDGLPWRSGRKPWPKEMGQWSHPRHGADGNCVSEDLLVALPERIRWVTGPQQEISNMVTAGGRCYFAGVLVRDAFNGLRLWNQKLSPSPARGGFGASFLPGSVLPIATGKSLLVVTDKKLQALDAATGRLLREYPEAGTPAEMILAAGMILVSDRATVRALDLETGRLCWKQDIPQGRALAAGDGMLYFLQGGLGSAEPPAMVCREVAGGKLCWQQNEWEWIPKVRQFVYHHGLLACEVSTLIDAKPGNAIHVLTAADGSLLWSHSYVPGASHKKQARAMFAGGLLWTLDEKNGVGLDPRTGKIVKTFRAPATHCFPPVATDRYLLSGELDFTDLTTGKLAANQITKTACSREAGVVPANGLLYTFPKHCICWPMLRDYAALAAKRPGGLPRPDAGSFQPETGPASPPQISTSADASQHWPSYRNDAWRSAGTLARAPRELKMLWSANLGGRPEGAITEDWRTNYFIRGPIGPPVVAGGLAYVARPDAHQVVAFDSVSGTPRWTFTANGRVDTAPTIHRGLCLFGCKSGWVYCLKADDGAMVWRLRAAPVDERIVAYGQLESPWPVPGSVLAIDDMVYFAAGRHALADGGILVFAVEAATGSVRWVQCLDRVPQKNFYGSSGLEFDNFDLLHREGDSVAMSRWLFDRATGRMTCLEKNGFAVLGDDGASVPVPRGSWSYAPRNETEQWPERPYVRPLTAFRGSALYGCSQDRKTLFRRDFSLNAEERFDVRWFAGWDTYSKASKGGDLWQSQRLARGATWSQTPLGPPPQKQSISAMILAGDAICLAGSQGRVCVIDAKTGQTLSQAEVAIPLWDGLAVAEGRLYLSTADGRLLCLGTPK